MSPKVLPGGFRGKRVLNLDCSYCEVLVCSRGMRAVLLADTKTELFSTDEPSGSVESLTEIYYTSKCKCRVKDAACTNCGNVIGYTVAFPCQACLTSCNNGHYWMFFSKCVNSSERLGNKGGLLTWQDLLLHDLLVKDDNKTRVHIPADEPIR